MKLFDTPLNIPGLAIVLSGVIFVIDINLPLGIAGGVPYMSVILIALWMPDSKAAIYLALLCSFLTLLGFYLSPQGGELYKVLANRFLALFAIWCVATLTVKWRASQQDAVLARRQIEIEKEKIFVATIQGAQHITNNLLNQLKLVTREVDRHPEFNQKVKELFTSMLDESNELMNSLSRVSSINAEDIVEAVKPRL